MADTNHHTIHTEGDGISYSGLGWSMLILTLVTLACYGIVWGFFHFLEDRIAQSDPARSPVAAAPVTPTIQDGRIVSGNTSTPPLLVNEPENLEKFRAREHEVLTTYAWVDQGAGTIRVPIEAAMDLLITKGLPVQGGGR